MRRPFTEPLPDQPRVPFLLLLRPRPRARLALSVSAFAVYGLAFFPLVTSFGPAASALVALPVVLVAWLDGVSGGLLAGLLAIPLNTLLFNLAGFPGWDAIFRRGGGPGMAVLFLLAAIVGRMSDLGRQLYEQVSERNRMQEVLRNSEERYRVITELVSDYAYAYRIEPDGSHVLEWVTEAYTRITGYTPDELNTAWNWERVIHPEDRDRAAEHVRRLFAGERGSTEYRIVTRGGEVRWLRDSFRPEMDPAQGRLVRVYGAAEDITERKRADERLRLQGSALEAAANGIVITDREGVIRWVNPAFTPLTGYSAEEAIGQTLQLVRSGMQSEAFYHTLWATILAGQVWHGEIVNRRKDGCLYTEELTITPVPDERGEIRHFVAIMKDVTERRQAEAALWEREQKLRGIVELSADGIVLTDEAGRIVEWNRGEERITGQERDEVWGRAIWDVQYEAMPQERKTPAAHERLKAMVQGFLQSGQAPWANQLREREFIRADGSRRVVQSLVFPIQTEKGFIACAISRDVTAERRAEEALRQSDQRLRAVIANVPVILFGLDREGRFTLSEGRGLAALGLAPGEVVGKSALELYGHAPGAADALRRALASEAVRWTGKIGGVHFETQLAPLQDPAGRGAGVLGVAIDITERRQRERELEAIVAVADALRAAPTRAAMLPVILDQLLDLLGVGGAALALLDPVGGETVIELARGDWTPMTGVRLPPGAGVSGRVITSGQAYVSEDVRADPGVARPDLTGDLHAVACVPLLAQERVIGALLVGRRTTVAEAEVRLLSAIAGMAGNAIHRAALHEQTARRAEELAVLSAIGRRLTESLDLTAVLDGLLEETGRIVPGHALAVMLYDASRAELWIEAARGYPTDAWRGLRVRRGEGITGQVAASLMPALVREVGSNPAWLGVDGMPRSGSEIAVPLIFRNGLVGVINAEGRETGAFDENHLRLLTAIADYAAVAVENARLFAGLQASNAELSLAYGATIEGWGRALELRDRETEGHTRRVTELTVTLARALGLGEDEIAHLRRGALLHDIGKMGIPDSILLKPGPLTDDEWGVMRRHPVYAYEMLSPIPYLRPALDIPYGHHERWDGTGYPRGLKGEQIPLAARIFAVADVWDALTSDRPYRAAWPGEKVREYLREQAGTHFDPRVVNVLLEMLRDREPGGGNAG